MCGIVTVIRKDGHKAIKQTMKAYENQKSRGQLGFGYVAFSNGEVEDVCRNSTEKGIYLALRHLNSEAIIFHHRFPTSTPNFKEGAHPIYVSNPRLKYDYYVVHNGVITNDDYLKEQHEKLGYKYTTEMTKFEVWTTRDEEYTEKTVEVKFNDSECLAIELAECIENGKDKVEAYGSIAFVCMQTTKDDGQNVIKVNNVFFGRNTNPLKLENNNNFLKLSSEGNGELVKEHTLFKYDPNINLLSEKECQFGSKYTYKWNDDKSKVDKKDKDDRDFDDIPDYSGVGFSDRKDIREYLDERYEDKMARRQEEIERKLDEDQVGVGGDDEDYCIDEPVLVGDETLSELLEYHKKCEDEFEKLYSKGEIEKADIVMGWVQEIEEAIEGWAEANVDADPDTKVEEQPKLLNG